MGWLNKVLYNSKTSAIEDIITIDITPQQYYKALAIHNAVSLIANAIGECEFIVYEKGKKVKNEDYYKLNISPNPNQTASLFWHKVIEKALAYDGSCLAFETAQGLFVADEYNIKEQRDLLGHKYNSIVIGDVTLRKTFSHDEVFLFELDHTNIKELIDGAFNDYGDLIDIASKSFKRSNANRYKFKIHADKSGDEAFMKTYTNILSKQIKEYVKNDNGVYPEFEGYELVPETPQNKSSNSSDFVNIRKDMFEMVAMAYKIPTALLKGESRAIGEVMDEFMTFAVKPVVMMIEQVLNKSASYENWLNGNFIKVDASRVYHHDVFDVAGAVDKMISSGVYSIDETREKMGDLPINKDWSTRHYITKNYADIESSTTSMEGGE